MTEIGWSIKRQRGTSHRVLERPGRVDIAISFHDYEEIGPKMLARIPRQSGLKPDDL